MAKALNQNTKPAEVGDNSQSIKGIIAEVVPQIIDLKAERSAIGTKLTKLRGQVRSHGITSTDLNTAIRFYELEGEERKEALDNLKTCFEALQIGAQADMFPAPE